MHIYEIKRTCNKMLLSLYCIGFIVTTSYAFNNQNVKSTLERPVYSSQEEISEKDRALLAYVNFECTGRSKGYYADQEFDCYVFHYCDDYHKRYSYKCKAGKRFDQESAKCKTVLNSRCRGGAISQNKTSFQRDYLFSSNKVSKSERISSYSSLNSDEDLEALSAFASLTVKPDIRKPPFNNNQLSSSRKEELGSLLSPPTQKNSKKTGRKQDTYFPLSPNSYSVYDLTIPSPSPSIVGEVKKSKFLPSEKLERVAQASNNQRFYENYYPYSNSEGQRQSPVFSTTPFPVFHSIPPIDKSFNHFQNLAREIEPINIKFNSHVDRPFADQSFVPFPKSHFNFSPPGSTFTLKHPNIHAPLGGLIHPPPLKRPDSFHNTNSFKPINNKPKPPSIFASPSPSPIFTSPTPPHFSKSHHPSVPEHFPRNPFGNLLRHDPPVLYRNPYQHLQLTPNYNLYGNIPYTLGPPLGISNINSFPNPNVGIESGAIHPQNLPIKKSHKTVKIPDQDNKQKKVNYNLPPDINNKFNKEEKRILPKSPIPEVKESPENVDHENVVPSKKKLFPNANRERLQNKLRTGSRIRSKNKLIKDEIINTVSEDVKEPSRNNLEQNHPTSTGPPKQISPSRSLRRKTLRNKIISSEEPKIDQATSTVSTLDIPDHINDEKLEDNYDIQGADIADEISTTASIITTAKPSKDLTKPHSLRGSLKDRLNRLSTRRRISGQGKIGSRNKELLKPDIPSKTKEVVHEKKAPPVRLRSRKFPTFKRDESENSTLTAPATSERLKSRVSNFHKERSQGRLRPQRPLRKRIEEEKIIIKEDKEVKETKEQIDEQTTQGNSDYISKGTTETSTEIQSTDIVETVNEKETSTEGKRKRKMSPDVRARFKEFLKSRRKKTKTEDDSANPPELNNEKVEVKAEKPVIEIKENPSPLVSTDKKNSSLLENETGEEVEFIADESTTMEKSVPLVREEKVIVLNKEDENPFNRGDKKFPETLYRSKSAYTYSPQSIFSHSSGKPFRYLLNKIKNRKGTQHPYFHSREQVEILPKKDNDQKESSSTVSPSITEHKVVTPSNFKQIVRMHPRNPNNEMYKNVTLQEPIQEDSSTEAQTPSYNENEVYIVDVSKSKENKKPNDSRQTLTPNITFEEPLLKSSNLELTDNEEEEEDTRVSKPVFNLDSITYRMNDKVSHISALDTNDYREKIGSINFEPFATANGKPQLPIEKLLKLSK